MKTKLKGMPGAVVAELSVAEHGLGPILGAAYLLTDRVYARVDGDPKKALIVTLVPKEPLKAVELAALKDEFELELATQKLRWALAADNAGVREHVTRQAVLFVNGHPLAPASAQASSAGSPQGGADPLSAEQQAEIDRLIAEVETEIKDLKSKPAGADPDGVKATWEETHGEGK